MAKRHNKPLVSLRSLGLYLAWGNIRLLGNNRYVFVEQQKTGEYMMTPLGNMAQQYLHQKPADANLSDKVFAISKRTVIITSCKWIAKRAGINKNVSLRTSRHTFHLDFKPARTSRW